MAKVQGYRHGLSYYYRILLKDEYDKTAATELEAATDFYTQRSDAGDMCTQINNRGQALRNAAKQAKNDERKQRERK